MALTHRLLGPVFEFLAQPGSARVAHGDGGSAHYVGQHQTPARTAFEAAVRLFADPGRFTQVRVFCGRNTDDVKLPQWRIPGPSGGPMIVGQAPLAFSIFPSSTEATPRPAPNKFQDDDLSDLLTPSGPPRSNTYRITEVQQLEHLPQRVEYLLEEFEQAPKGSLLLVDETYFRYTGQRPRQPYLSGQGDELGADDVSKLGNRVVDQSDKFCQLPAQCARRGVSILLVFHDHASAESFIRGELFQRRVPQLRNDTLLMEIPQGFYTFSWHASSVFALPPAHRNGRPHGLLWAGLDDEKLHTSSISSLIRTRKLRCDEDPLAELRNMEGMGGIVKKLEGWNAARSEALRREQLEGRPRQIHRITENILLLGNPGTGKSTVAKRIADCLRKAGLSGPKYREVSAKDLIAGYVGQTGGKTAEVCRDALGGVLFVDEAYAIAEDENFGPQCLSELLKWLEDGVPLVIIMAGYKENMQRLRTMNAGIPRRFGCVFELPDYNVDQLLKITQSHAKDRGTELDAGALSILRQKLEAEIKACQKSARLFSNAGFAVGLLKSSIDRRALRLEKLGWNNVGLGELSRITAKDVAEATFAESQ